MDDDRAESRVPERLYKYRRPDVSALRRILLEDGLWAARPSTFNDPFDCYPYIDLSGTYDEALAFIDLRVARTGLRVSRENRRRMARDIHKRGLASIDPSAVGPDLWRRSVDEFGIISFSEECTSILMWSHYAQDHTGVCLEFGTETQPTSVVAKVVYSSSRPVFRPLAPDRTGLMERILLHKADIWSYEREWRHFRIREGPGLTPFPASSLKSVILGAAVSAPFERELNEMLAERALPVPIRRARFDDRHFRLRIE